MALMYRAFALRRRDLASLIEAAAFGSRSAASFGGLRPDRSLAREVVEDREWVKLSVIELMDTNLNSIAQRREIFEKAGDSESRRHRGSPGPRE